MTQCVCVCLYVCCPPSTSVDTAIKASSCTPPDPAVLFSIPSSDDITMLEIWVASSRCTFRSTFCTHRHTQTQAVSGAASGFYYLDEN